ncbi:MAG: hypothetical protein A2Y60_06150 [Chloroflexi bacterium RBG_13_54_9]|nr:MAG: hypothetical protein A2Y60_06150 [Chloroflexi bacterium RBG_13_54_9]
MNQPLEPHLRIGAICERVLEEKDGAISLIRVIDRLIITAQGADVPQELPPGQAVITAVMSWAGGLGSYEAKIRVQMPGGESLETETFPFLLDSLDRAHNIIVQWALPIKRQGVYWVEFLLGDEVKSRAPWRVVYQRKQIPRPRANQST